MKDNIDRVGMKSIASACFPVWETVRSARLGFFINREKWCITMRLEKVIVMNSKSAVCLCVVKEERRGHVTVEHDIFATGFLWKVVHELF